MCAAALAALALGGCADPELDPICTFGDPVPYFPTTTVDKLDVLFVVDNSNSTAEEQISLVEQLGPMIEALTSGDRDLDGSRDFPPIRSLHLGVISTDMGTGGFRVPTCDDPDFGDDGVLRTAGNTARPGCLATYPRFIEFVGGGPAPPEVVTDVTCVAAIGEGGCGFEQPLEAMLKAVTPSTADVTFARNTRGHADVENASFLRPDAALAIIVLTDEDDCSIADPELANPTSTVYPGDLNMRCFAYPDGVHPVQRYVDGLLATRSDRAGLIYAAITGVPVDLVRDPTAIDYDAILADPRMQGGPDPALPTRPVPSCNEPGHGISFAPRRIVRVAQGLAAQGARTTVQSICQTDFGAAVAAIVDEIAGSIDRGGCLARPLTAEATGTVSCDVLELLAPPRTCAEIPGRVPDGVDVETGRERCLVVQRVVTDADGDGTVSAAEAPEPGWYYDRFTRDAAPCGRGGRISYTPGAAPMAGTTTSLECVPSRPSGEDAFIDNGTRCVPESDGICGAAGDVVDGRTCRRPLVCDPVTRTYATPCTSDADCASADLRGYECGGASAFCVDTTCVTAL